MQNYHQMCLKLLANVFTTAKGRASMRDQAKASYLIEFCNTSFKSCNQKVSFHAAVVLFNYLLAFETETKKPYNQLLELSIRGIDELLKKPEITDKDTLVALILCICRVLFKNHEMCVFVEDPAQSFFKDTMMALKGRSASLAPEV